MVRGSVLKRVVLVLHGEGRRDGEGVTGRMVRVSLVRGGRSLSTSPEGRAFQLEELQPDDAGGRR